MKIAVFIFILIFTTSKAFCQVQPNWEQCPGADSACGPYQSISFREQLHGDRLKEVPNCFILHQGITRGKTNYSTGSFIAPDMILTAHHNVWSKVTIRRYRFCNKAVDPSLWVTLKPRDVEIITFGSVKAPTDLAIIRIKNPQKLQKIYKGHFEIGSLDSSDSSALVHLTGFPCDLPDILVDKKTTISELNLKSESSLIGFQMYTCTGDSGAPLWTLTNGVPTIVGIHHGGGEHYFPDDWNCAASIGPNVLDWIESIKK